MAILPERVYRSRAYWVFQRVLHVLQFLSAITSLAVFSARLYKILHLAHRASVSNGVVEGILAAAAAYTLVIMVLTVCLKGGGPRFLRWIMLVFDILFVAAFIVVAYLTRPNGGSSGPCKKSKYQVPVPKGVNCQLPWGSFALAIFSTLLHSMTILFHEARDKYRVHNSHVKDERDYERNEPIHSGRSNNHMNGNNNLNGNDHINGNHNTNGNNNLHGNNNMTGNHNPNMNPNLNTNDQARY